ncbi:MAG TPA: hypothetical protein VKX35_08115 [Fermentimonas sp.]|nr:hypothetical protein [Fermentimonas sp.]
MMIKQEFLRYLKSKFNLLLVTIMLLPVAGSYYTTYLEKKEWKSLLHSPAPDLNISLVRDIVNGYSGAKYFEKFIFSGDYYIIFIIVILAGLGVHIGSTMYRNLATGFGNQLIIRLSFKKYLDNLLIAQSLYISVFILAYLIFVGSLSCIINGYSSSRLLFNLQHIAIHVLILVVYVILVLLITSLLTVYFHNKHLLQLTPLIVYFVPLLLASALGNEFIFKIMENFVADNYLLAVYFTDIPQEGIFNTLLSYGSLPLLLVIIFQYLYTKNITSFGRDYIK